MGLAEGVELGLEGCHLGPVVGQGLSVALLDDGGKLMVLKMLLDLGEAGFGLPFGVGEGGLALEQALDRGLIGSLCGWA